MSKLEQDRRARIERTIQEQLEAIRGIAITGSISVSDTSVMATFHGMRILAEYAMAALDQIDVEVQQ